MVGSTGRWSVGAAVSSRRAGEHDAVGTSTTSTWAAGEIVVVGDAVADVRRDAQVRRRPPRARRPKTVKASGVNDMTHAW